MNKVLELTEKVMRALEDHKTDLAFLECEVVQSSLQQTGNELEDDQKMDVDQEMLVPYSLSKAASRISKSSEVSHI